MLKFCFVLFFENKKSAKVCWPIVKKVVITQPTINNYSTSSK